MPRQLLCPIAVFLFLVSMLHAQSGTLSLASTLNISPAQGVATKGDILYVNPGGSMIKVVDISDPSNPQYLPDVTYSGDFTHRINADGDYLYLYGGPSGLFKIFDISTPSAPVEMGTCAFNQQGAVDAAHAPNYSYLTLYDNIFVINTTDKNNPYIQSTLTVPNVGTYGLRDATVYQNALYIATASGVLVYDISNPALPVSVSSFPNGFVSTAIDPAGQRLYVTGWGTAHEVANLGSPLAPTFQYSAIGGTATSGDIAYQSGYLLQTGPDPGPPTVQSVNFFRADGSSSTWLQEFFGTLQYSITDIIGKDSLFIVAKFGGVEILRFGSVETSIEAPHEIQFQLSPNPASDVLRLDLQTDLDEWRAEILDLQGKSLLSLAATGHRTEISVATIPAGMYFLRVTGEEGRVETRPFVKH